MNSDSTIAKLQEDLNKSGEHTLHEFATLHTGKANTSMAENVTVDVYGSSMKLRDIAAITTPDARTIQIQPWDKSSVAPIEKALIEANLGISPVVTGELIRLPIPELSGERREELCKMAYERLEADGVLIHMLLGKLKEGDIPGDIRDAAIRKMVELYFKENTAIISGFGFDMMYAGPREALLHAVFRQNAGCTHLIVGRDHAGVGDYYEPFEAQEIFDLDIVRDSLKIEIFKADHTAYSKKLDKVVMMRDAEDHSKDDFVLLSGTKVREMLAAGQELPPEFARKEVAKILMTYYQERS